MTDKEIEQVRKDGVKKLLQKLHNKTFELVDSCDNECEESFEVVDRSSRNWVIIILYIIAIIALLIPICLLLIKFNTKTKTALDWCALDVSKNYDGSIIFSVDNVCIEYTDGVDTDDCVYAYIITVFCNNADGNPKIDYWFCYIKIKGSMLFSKGDNPVFFKEDIEIIDCDLFKTENYIGEK